MTSCLVLHLSLISLRVSLHLSFCLLCLMILRKHHHHVLPNTSTKKKKRIALREKRPYSEFLWSVFSPNERKYGKTPNTETFHAA